MEYDGYDLIRRSEYEVNYTNYTRGGYKMTVANVTASLYKVSTNVFGAVKLSFSAQRIDNKTNETLTAESQIEITIPGIQPVVSPVEIKVDKNLNVSEVDLKNFLQAYYDDAIVTTIAAFYNITIYSKSLIVPVMEFNNIDITRWVGNAYPWSPNFANNSLSMTVTPGTRTLKKTGNDVTGSIKFNLFTTQMDPIRQITVYDRCDVELYVPGQQHNDSMPYIYFPARVPQIKVSDLDRALKSYYLGMVLPNIVSFYNITVAPISAWRIEE